MQACNIESFVASDDLAKSVAFGAAFNGKVFGRPVIRIGSGAGQLAEWSGVEATYQLVAPDCVLLGYVIYDDDADWPISFVSKDPEGEVARLVKVCRGEYSVGTVCLSREHFEEERARLPARQAAVAALTKAISEYGSYWPREYSEYYDLERPADAADMLRNAPYFQACRVCSEDDEANLAVAIAGAACEAHFPCVIESEEGAVTVSVAIVDMAEALGIKLVG
jgi:hypothetical protein